MPSRAVLLIALALAGCATQRQGSSTREDAGRSFAERACAGCHAIGQQGESPHGRAPPFRDLASLRSDAELAAALSRISKEGHVEMPPIYITPDEMKAIVAYMRGLTGRAA